MVMATMTTTTVRTEIKVMKDGDDGDGCCGNDGDGISVYDSKATTMTTRTELMLAMVTTETASGEWRNDGERAATSTHAANMSLRARWRAVAKPKVRRTMSCVALRSSGPRSLVRAGLLIIHNLDL